MWGLFEEEKKERKEKEKQEEGNKEKKESCIKWALNTCPGNIGYGHCVDRDCHSCQQAVLMVFCFFLFSTFLTTSSTTVTNRLLGLMVKASASRTCGYFCGSSHTSAVNIGTPVAILQGALRNKVSAGTDWPGVSIL